VDLNVERRTVMIVYEDIQVTEPQIEKRIEKTGFETEVRPASAKARQKIAAKPSSIQR